MTPTTTHTPGPWTMTDDFIAIYDNDGRCIADMGSEASPEIGVEETLANAQLIVAAPALLEALKGALDALEEAGEYPHTARLARRAITLATGNNYREYLI